MFIWCSVVEFDRRLRGSTARPFRSSLEELRGSIRKALNPQIIVFYGITAIVSSVISIILPYQSQVYLSIAAGVAVAILLTVSMIMSRGVEPFDLVFIAGVVFLLVALFKRGFLPPIVLQNLGHYALALSMILTGAYVAFQIFRGTRLRSHVVPAKSLSDMLSVSSTTISSELCSCLHPMPVLDALGITAFLPNQVRLGFVIMMTTLVYQTRLTYEYYKSRTNSAMGSAHLDTK